MGIIQLPSPLCPLLRPQIFHYKTKAATPRAATTSHRTLASIRLGLDSRMAAAPAKSTMRRTTQFPYRQ